MGQEPASAGKAEARRRAGVPAIRQTDRRGHLEARQGLAGAGQAEAHQ